MKKGSREIIASLTGTAVGFGIGTSIGSPELGAMVGPLGGTYAQAVFAEWQEGRITKCLEEIWLALKNRGMTKEEAIERAKSIDGIIPAILRFQDASIKGMARRNMRLMAQIIAGRVAASDLRADDFLDYLDRLSRLSREEILLLGYILKAHKDLKPDNGKLEGYTLWDHLIAHHTGNEIFPDADTIEATAWGLGQSGFLWQRADVDNIGKFIPTPLLWKIAMECDIESVGTVEESDSPAGI
jgi:hypothetical protein